MTDYEQLQIIIQWFSELSIFLVPPLASRHKQGNTSCLTNFTQNFRIRYPRIYSLLIMLFILFSQKEPAVKTFHNIYVFIRHFTKRKDADYYNFHKLAFYEKLRLLVFSKKTDPTSN